MRLEFRLLVIDDNPTSIEGAIRGLRTHLEGVGFVLSEQFADDFTDKGYVNSLGMQARTSTS